MTTISSRNTDSTETLHTDGEVGEITVWDHNPTSGTGQKSEKTLLSSALKTSSRNTGSILGAKATAMADLWAHGDHGALDHGALDNGALDILIREDPTTMTGF